MSGPLGSHALDGLRSIVGQGIAYLGASAEPRFDVGTVAWGTWA